MKKNVMNIVQDYIRQKKIAHSPNVVNALNEELKHKLQEIASVKDEPYEVLSANVDGEGLVRRGNVIRTFKGEVDKKNQEVDRLYTSITSHDFAPSYGVGYYAKNFLNGAIFTLSSTLFTLLSIRAIAVGDMLEQSMGVGVISVAIMYHGMLKDDTTRMIQD